MIYLMDLPKPVHGMSNVNLAIKTQSNIAKLNPKVINTVPSYAAKLFSTKWWGLVKVIHTFLCFIQLFIRSFLNFKGVLYRPINGGTGQVYDVVYLLIARLFLNKIYLHHHSFNYLNTKSRLFSLLNTIAGKNAVHIVLGSKMKTVLAELYDIENKNISVISNLAYFTPDDTMSLTQNSVIKIGHLANLCSEKGADIFVEVCRTLHKQNVDFSAEIAGPFADLATEKLVLTAVDQIADLHYVGPLYKEQKLQYYQQLDCFIFPSKYKNEAEPLVLFEAANSGGLLLGTQRGCMKDVIHSLKGESFKEDEQLVDNIVMSITSAIEQGSLKSDKKQVRLTNFLNEQVTAKIALDKFLDEIGSYELSRSQ